MADFFSKEFYRTVEYLFSGLGQAEMRRFFLLTTLGQYGAKSIDWLSDFRNLGVLHLLVLSGSQVSYFGTAIRKTINLICRCLAIEPTLLRGGVLSAGYLLFGGATGWEPPLTRAILLGLGQVFLPRLSFVWSLALSLFLQMALFPHHLLTLGFYLSWFSFLCLMLVQMSGIGKFFTCVWVSLFCQLIVSLVLQRFLDPMSWVLLILSNIVLGFFFEELVMPIVGWALLTALILLCLQDIAAPAANIFVRDTWAPLFHSVAHLVLVVMQTLMYIGFHES